jgi:hypothetical protein
MLPVPELECRCGRGIKWGDAKPLVQFGLVDRHAVQFHQVFLERKGEKANVRIVVQKDGGRVVLLYCSGLVVNVIDDGWFGRRLCRGGEATRTDPAILLTLLTTFGFGAALPRWCGNTY